jgi:hypothetical protein
LLIIVEHPPVYYFLSSLIVFLCGERRGGRLEKGDCHFFLLTPAIKDLLYKIQTSFFFIKKDIEEERGIKKQNT